jgi:hypothetical protein
VLFLYRTRRLLVPVGCFAHLEEEEEGLVAVAPLAGTPPTGVFLPVAWEIMAEAVVEVGLLAEAEARGRATAVAAA